MYDEQRENYNCCILMASKLCKKEKLVCGMLKCNVDASFSNVSNEVGIGICIRDEEGQHIRSKTMWFTALCSVDIGEALGLYHAIRWIYDLQPTNVDFEVDSEKVAGYYNGLGRYITQFALIMDCSMQLCSAQLTNSNVSLLGGK